jgi:hypothetical protein
MKITESRIRRIIREELSRIIESREPSINISQTDKHVNIDVTSYPEKWEEELGYVDPRTETTSLDISTATDADGELRTVHLGKLQAIKALPLPDHGVHKPDPEDIWTQKIVYYVPVGGNSYWLPGASVAKDDKGRNIPVIVYGSIYDPHLGEMYKFEKIDANVDYEFSARFPGLEASHNWSNPPDIPLDDHEPPAVEYKSPFTADWCDRNPGKCPPDPDYRVSWDDTDLDDFEGETFEPQDRPSRFTMPWSEKPAE